jgi:hypothetical protein
MTGIASSLLAALSVMSSGKVAAPSSRCAARDNTISCVWVSLVDVDLRVVSFVMFGSWRFEPGHYRPVTTATPLRRSEMTDLIDRLCGGFHKMAGCAVCRGELGTGHE